MYRYVLPFLEVFHWMPFVVHISHVKASMNNYCIRIVVNSNIWMISNCFLVHCAKVKYPIKREWMYYSLEEVKRDPF